MEDNSEDRDEQENEPDIWVPPPMISRQWCLCRSAQCSVSESDTITSDDVIHDSCGNFITRARDCLQSQCCGIYAALCTFISIICVWIFFEDYYKGFNILRPISVCATVISFIFCCTFLALRCYGHRQNRYTYRTLS